MKRKDLVELIRKIVREEISEALDKHLDDYSHQERPLDECEKETK